MIAEREQHLITIAHIANARLELNQAHLFADDGDMQMMQNCVREALADCLRALGFDNIEAFLAVQGST